MIVKMKLATIIMYSPKKREFLDALKELGLLHIKKMTGKGQEFEYYVNSLIQVNEAIAVLEKIENQHEKSDSRCSQIESCVQLAKRVLVLSNENADMQEKISSWTKQQEDWSFWGDFTPSDFALLNENGIDLSLYTLPKKKLKKIPEGFPYFQVASNKALCGIVSCLRNEQEVKLPDFLKAVTLPEFGISELEAKKGELSAQIAKNSLELDKYVRDLPLLLSLQEELESAIEFTSIETGSTYEDEEKLSVIQGYIPADEANNLALRCKKEEVALLLEDIDEDDEEVPVLVKNNKIVKLISPVFNLLGTIPGYREYDISPFFLAFFSLFFAMIIGDAGYGAILLVGAVTSGIVSLIKGKQPGIATILLGWLSFTTLIWGAITGSWFGSQQLVAEGTFLSQLIIPQMNAFDPRSTEFIMRFCFIIAVVHLTIAHTMNFIREIMVQPYIRSFTQIGKLFLLYGLYFLVNNLLFGDQMPVFAPYFIGIGFLLVLICSEQDGEFLKGIAKGFANIIVIFLDTISMFSDIISYIRLSAVGMASLEIAKAFNSMSASMMEMESQAIGLVAGVIIVFFGHTLNLILGGLSVVVHGVRLNMLEFSGHLGMEWTGDLYDPFRDRRIVKNNNL